ncbi:MAG: nickel pincer cofactor biosynthesis protein LarB [Candidatus Competibacterales bacterium]
MSANEFVLDRDRPRRLGFGEAIFCLDKSPSQIQAIAQSAHERGEALLLTRLAPQQVTELAPPVRDALDYDPVSRTAHLGQPPPPGPARVAVVSAGTSDVPVAKEAVRTLLFNGHSCDEHYDVGVAGLWRLLERLDAIKGFEVVIAVAGMDAALPSVLGGLLASPIIAVPTSTGYGATHRGHTALHAILASCAPGLLTVNIDNGYGAACGALRILQGAHRRDSALKT